MARSSSFALASLLSCAFVVVTDAGCSACSPPAEGEAGEGEGEAGEGEGEGEGGEGEGGEGEGEGGEGEGGEGEGEGEGGPNDVVISILDISDWHGQLDPLVIK